MQSVVEGMSGGARVVEGNGHVAPKPVQEVDPPEPAGGFGAFAAAVFPRLRETATVCDERGRILFTTNDHRPMLGYKPGGLAGKSVFDLWHPDDLTSARAAWDDLVARPGARVVREYRLRAADGSWQTVEGVAHNLLHDPAVGGILLCTQYVGHLRRELHYQLLHDAVTGLGNRTLLLRELAALLDNASTSPALALVSVSIDRAVTIIDALGFSGFDHVLRTLADRVTDASPRDALATRVGDTEFVIALPDRDTDPHHLAADLLARLAVPIEVDDEPVVLSACAGIVSLADAEGLPCGPEDLVRYGEMALHLAQQHGPGTIETFRPQHAVHSAQRLSDESELRRALDEDQFVLHYQPEYVLRGRHLIGAEALLRWRHPTRGLLGPPAFLQRAEEAGLMDRVGAWVLEAACRQAAEWQDGTGSAPAPRAGRRATDRAPRVWVNLSPSQLNDDDLTERIAETLHRFNTPPWAIGVEVTETALFNNEVGARRTLADIHSLGLDVALDDFGTGYSSLAHLRNFPVNVVKVDRSFVDLLGTEHEASAIVAAVLGMAHAVGKQVVAEGVERPDQLVALRILECDIVQGFLLGRPGPPTDLRSQMP